MTPEELKEMTGQANYQQGPRLVLNEVNLNGQTGEWRKIIYVGKEGDGKPEEEKLADTVSLVFLKIRRKLVERAGKEGNILRQSNEHNTHNDNVCIYQEGKEVFRGNAKDAREQYDGLRTVQVVYALLLGAGEPELVRVKIKGSSLGSEDRPKEYPDFYQYVGTFSEEPLCGYVTKLGILKQEGKMTYYSATYTRGLAVSADKTPLVYENLQKVHEFTSKQDKVRGESTSKTPAVADDIESIQYPEDDINPEDIPF